MTIEYEPVLFTHVLFSLISADCSLCKHFREQKDKEFIIKLLSKKADEVINIVNCFYPCQMAFITIQAQRTSGRLV